MIDNQSNNIVIAWDFDGTLTPKDSTTEVISFLKEEEEDAAAKFWNYVKSFSKEQEDFKEYLPAVDAPIWMYSLSKIANDLNIALNEDFFQEYISQKIKLFDNVIPFLYAIKKLENEERFQKCNIKIHHFIVSAGLRDLIKLIFPEGLITYTFGCRYKSISYEENIEKIENIPIFCIDETVKTRALFEISKGAFCTKNIKVNTKISDGNYWAPFNNFIYIGDGDTDIPALSLTRTKGGLGIVVYNKNKPLTDIKEKLHTMSADKRADLITPADFKINGELYTYITNRCHQILQRYEVEYIFKKKSK